ncbi:hypothetical protein HanLR1_Chr11g0392741 [Helianthus annuus]|nr:hypothetical protein HanLR1_Chr11g0392741 [Helianthus annuus]
MPGESSRAGRKRGPTTHSRGEPAQQQPVQQQQYVRVVEYSGPGVPHGQSTRLLDSPLLQFELDSGESQRLATLYTMDMLPFRRIDWGLIDRLGARARVEQLLGPKFRRVLDCDAMQYKEITLEFHSTFDYKQGNFNETDAVFFALGK